MTGGPAAAVAEPAIEISGLSNSYGAVEAVKSLDLRIEANEMFALVGPDGAGKTTTIRLLCGILKPHAGERPRLRARPRRRTSRGSRRRSATSPSASVSTATSPWTRTSSSSPGSTACWTSTIAATSFSPSPVFFLSANRLADRLSGGMKQKLALACTLVHRPRLIFLDEPTTGVDPVSRREFWIILSRLLREGITIVMSTPYLDEAERASRVGLMNAGRLMAVERPARIKAGMNGAVLEIVCPDIRRARRRPAAVRSRSARSSSSATV